MREVTGPVIAIVLTLCAVFVPIAFLGGLTGELYRQFAVTISIAVVISGIVALTLTPALCVLILKREHQQPGRFFRAFNRWFARVTDRYADGVAWMIRRGGIGAAAVRRHGGGRPPACGASRRASLVPDEDQGFYIAAVILPDGATLERTDKVVSEVIEVDQVQPGQRGRRSPSPASTSSAAASATTRPRSSSRRSTGTSATVPAPAAGGRALHEDRRTSRKRWCSPSTRRRSSASAPPAASSSTSRTAAKAARKRLAEVTQQFLGARERRTRMLGGVQTLWRANVPQLYVDVDREKAKALGVPLDEVFNTLAATLGTLLRQRLQQVRPHLAGADVGRAAATASAPTTSARSTCARDKGEMVPLSALAQRAATRRAPTRSTASTTCRR